MLADRRGFFKLQNILINRVKPSRAKHILQLLELEKNTKTAPLRIVRFRPNLIHFHTLEEEKQYKELMFYL